MADEKFNNYDVFHSFLVSDADYDGEVELPVIRTSDAIPDRVLPFSKAMEKSRTDFDFWVIFYEHDAKFERLNSMKQVYQKNKLMSILLM